MDWQIFEFNKKAYETEYQPPDLPCSFKEFIKKEKNNNTKEPMANSYRLLKDLPNLEAGAIFEPNEIQYRRGEQPIVINYIQTRVGLVFPSNSVENNPDWFEIVEDKKYKLCQVTRAIEQSKRFIESCGFEIFMENVKDNLTRLQ